MSDIEQAAKALTMFRDTAEPGESFGAWLARNSVIDWSRVPAIRLGRSGGTFHERKAARVAARAGRHSKGLRS